MKCKKCNNGLTKNGFCRSCNNPSKINGGGFKGKKHMETSNEKRSNTIKELYKQGKNMGFFKKHKPWNYGLTKHNDIRLKKCSEKQKGKIPYNKLPDKKIKCKYCGKRIIVSFNSNKKFCSKSCGAKCRFLNDSYLKKKIEEMHNGKRERITKWTKKLGIYLKEEKISFEYEYKIGKFWADIYIPNYNMLIECDGEYWHNYPNGTEKDFRKIEFYKKAGFNVLNLWNSVINKLSKNEFLFLLKKCSNI